MEADYDEAKDAANVAKHGLSLAFGGRVLRAPGRITKVDTRRDYGETRFIAFGRVEERLYVAVWSQRGDVARIISVRKANERERREYDQA
jgi:uncharacterized DUF497 family protein